jgi:hypothetical protein
MIKKALHRITVCWCLYGLYRFYIWTAPYLVWIADYIFDKAGDMKFSSEACPSSLEALIVWIVIISIGAIAFLVCAAIHHISNWFFNTKAS